MFPGIPLSEIDNLLSRYSLESTVEILSESKTSVATDTVVSTSITVTQPVCVSSVNVTAVSDASSARTTVSVAGQSSQSSPISIFGLPFHASLDTILAVHSCSCIDQSSPVFIKVDKSILWQRAVALYKGFKNTRIQLRRALAVEFHDEDGIDAGAIRLSFFELLMSEIDNQLFEGNQTRRVPKKDWGLSSLFEIAGMMVAHSVLNGGPALPCLLPAIYHGISTGDETELPPELMPCVDDFPNSLPYIDLIQFVQKVC